MREQESFGKTMESIFGVVGVAVGDQDRCCVCGIELDLAEPHDFDREKRAPKHRGCWREGII